MSRKPSKKINPIVLVDSTAIATVLRYADTVVRQPDFIDPVEQTAVWIGTDSSVEVEAHRVTPALAWWARNAYAFRDQRPAPEEFGIKVLTHDPEFINPAFAGRVNARELTLWAEFAEVLDAQTV